MWGSHLKKNPNEASEKERVEKHTPPKKAQFPHEN